MYLVLDGPIDLLMNCSQQQSLQMSGLLPVIYGILNASVILERNEKHLEKTSYYLKRNETSYVRNDTSGGNF